MCSHFVWIELCDVVIVMESLNSGISVISPNNTEQEHGKKNMQIRSFNARQRGSAAKLLECLANEITSLPFF